MPKLNSEGRSITKKNAAIEICEMTAWQKRLRAQTFFVKVLSF